MEKFTEFAVSLYVVNEIESFQTLLDELDEEANLLRVLQEIYRLG